jgi:hypothetical protein
VSNVAVPLIYQQLHALSGKFTEFGAGNRGIGVLAGYPRRNLHWFCETDIGLPGIGYSSGKVLNIGQHNYAAGPVAGFTYLSDRGKLEMSSRVYCIVTAGRETRSTRVEINSCSNTP